MYTTDLSNTQWQFIKSSLNFENSIILFQTEQGEHESIYEGNKMLVRLNEDYPDKNTKYSIYFLGVCLGLDELPLR